MSAEARRPEHLKRIADCATLACAPASIELEDAKCGSRSFWRLWRSCSPAATPIRRSIPPDRRPAARTIPAAILTIPPATRRTTSGSAAKSRSRDCRTGGEAFVGKHRSVWIFLGPPHFAAETPVYEGWNSLDFLGFSRSNRMVSMGCAGLSRTFFLEPCLGARSRSGLLRGHSEGGIVLGASLLLFLIVSNQSLSGPSSMPSLVLMGLPHFVARAPSPRPPTRGALMTLPEATRLVWARRKRRLASYQQRAAKDAAGPSRSPA
jgi:hypothetical protein